MEYKEGLCTVSYLTGFEWGEFEKKLDIGSKMPRTRSALRNSVTVEDISITEAEGASTFPSHKDN